MLPFQYNNFTAIYSGAEKEGDVMKVRENMPTNAEVIEELSRKLERAKILNDLKACETLEDYQKVTQKYEILCNDDKSE